MKPKSFMLIAGEPSGDQLAADLVRALRSEMSGGPLAPTTDFQPLQGSFAPQFFGAGGQHLAQSGVELALDMTAHSVIGFSDVVKKLLKFRRIFHQLLTLAARRSPDAVVCIDFSGFNRRLAHAIKGLSCERSGLFNNWNPQIIQFVSPQVWASRPGRATLMAEDYDLLLTIFPFEKAWYAERAPDLRVEFVGHPIVDRYSQMPPSGLTAPRDPDHPEVLLLPGSRPGELKRHLPVMFPAFQSIAKALPEVRGRMVLPNEDLLALARSFGPPPGLEIKCGGLTQALQSATVAIASTGTVTMECAWFGVPTVAIYKTSWSTYQIGKRLVTVRFLAMPNLLADREIFPELIQDAATPERVSAAALDLMRSPARQAEVRSALAQIVSGLGAPGASRRAAQAILRLPGLAA
jgi:lipid-A-disaccharide synthase